MTKQLAFALVNINKIKFEKILIKGLTCTTDSKSTSARACCSSSFVGTFRPWNKKYLL